VPVISHESFATSRGETCHGLTGNASWCTISAVAITLSLLASSSAFADQKPIKVGWSVVSQVHSRWAFEAKIMQAKAKEVGVDLIVQSADYDSAKQRTQVENMLSEGVNVIMITPVDGKIAGSLANEAHAANIPVIAYDTEILDGHVDYFVTRDNLETGRIQARAALRFAPTGNYVVERGDPSINVAHDFYAGNMEVLGPAVKEGTIKIVSDQWNKQWSTQNGLNQMENALTSHSNDIQACVSDNDTLGIGCVQAIREQGLAGKIFVSGNDASPEVLPLIAEGSMTMSVWTKIDEMANRAIQAAVDLANGKKPETNTTINNGAVAMPTQTIGQVEVNRENLCQFVTSIAPPGWANVADVYKNVSSASCK
jgi:D-xylose transport system substrate-binding protein